MDSSSALSSYLRRPGIVALLLAALVCAIYSTTLSFDFVTMDDPTHVLQNPVVIFRYVGAAFTETPACLWIPLTWISYMGDLVLGRGLHPWIFHLTNMLLHAANAILLWRWLDGATGRRWAALAVALLFAVHPLNVESVAWITERKNVLSTFFWLLALIAYTRYARTGKAWAYTATLVAGIAGLMSKPMLVTLPGTLLLLDAWPFDRFARVGWKRVIVEKIPFILLSIGVCAITMHAHAEEKGLFELPLSQRFMNAGSSYGFYLWQMIWPAELALQGRHPMTIPFTSGLAGWATVLLLSALTLWLRRKEPAILWGWLWYLGTLVPVIGLLQAGSEASADRFTYVPQFGIFVAVVWGLWPLATKHACVARVAFGAILVALTVRTVNQLPVWENGITLYKNTAQVYPRHYRAHANLGYAYARAGEHIQAINAYRAALELQPTDSETWNNLGASIAELGDDDRAIFAFKKALEYKPNSLGAGINIERANKRIAERAAKATQAPAPAPQKNPPPAPQ